MGTLGAVTLTGTDDIYNSVGESDDLWSEAWTPADINDIDFGWIGRFSSTDLTTIYVYVDHVQIEVTYTPLGGSSISKVNGATMISISKVNTVAEASIKAINTIVN